MMKHKLDNLEQEIENNIDSYISVSPGEKKMVDDIVSSANKRKNINIRLSSADLDLIRLQASRAGLPYQTFIASILHRYATRQLIDETSIYKTLNLMLKKFSI